MTAWRLLRAHCATNDRNDCWVSPAQHATEKRVPFKCATWGSDKFNTDWMHIDLDDIEKVLVFLLNNLFFTDSDVKAKQVNGLAMGSAFASALCILVLTMYEYTGQHTPAFRSYVENLSMEGTLLQCFRYVDDLRVIILCDAYRDHNYTTKVVDSIRAHIWHNVCLH